MKEVACYDVVIVGGGMVGASLACALGHQPIKTLLIEATPFRSHTQPSFDDRSVALSYGTQRIFESLGLWGAIQPSVTAIKHIHVSDRGYFGVTRMHAREQGVDALGYVIENRALGNVLATQLGALPHAHILCPAQLTNATSTPRHVGLTIKQDGQSTNITTRLLIAADGGDSAVRDQLGICVTRHNYEQVAIVANLRFEHSHRQVAYERFTEDGPLAVLPLSEDRCSLVWTTTPEKAAHLTTAADAEFINSLKHYFGLRLGNVTQLGVRKAYPLQLVRADTQVIPRVALIGNAAHTLHPVAGQGFNLGLRDVAVLAQVIIDALKDGRDPGGSGVLAAYADWRAADHARVVSLTDGLVKMFSNSFPPLALARNLGMIAIDILPPLKRALTRQTMGLTGKLPRLARGLDL